MKPFTLFAMLALALGACATTAGGSPQAQVPVAQAPAAQAPAATPREPSAAPAPHLLHEAPEDWQLLDAGVDGVHGISLRRAERELLANRLPKRTVVVAVIDGGVDTTHADIRHGLWANTGERGGTGRDDDGNGYVDDVRGWNFIGGADGRSVHHDTYEVTREHVLCGLGTNPPPAAAGVVRDSTHCKRVAGDLAKERAEAEQMLEQVRMLSDAFAFALPLLRQALGTDSLTPERVSMMRPASADVRQAQRVFMQLAANDITPAVLEDARKEFESRLQYKLNPEFEPRPIVGDEYKNFTQRHYGNSDVMGPDAKHGTHVAGIIMAMHRERQIDGAPAVRIMAMRAVPDGDERDKDVANAIRYAADHGAHIINMSFGKAYSPHRPLVDEAVRYAEQRGVLLVHAAGNDGADLATTTNFPSPLRVDGSRAELWIEVGASSWKGADSLAAPFTNYGRQYVDVFAPGVDIVSAVPGGGRERQSGTSMAAPVVSGLAALIMSYYPELSAADVRRIIVESAISYADQRVAKPGADGGTIEFGAMSASGGIVNAFTALQHAERSSTAR